MSDHPYSDHVALVLESCPDASEEDIVKEARAVLERVDNSKAAHFVRERLKQLDVLINMLDDDEWPLALDLLLEYLGETGLADSGGPGDQHVGAASLDDVGPGLVQLRDRIGVADA